MAFTFIAIASVDIVKLCSVLHLVINPQWFIVLISNYYGYTMNFVCGQLSEVYWGLSNSKNTVSTLDGKYFILEIQPQFWICQAAFSFDVRDLSSVLGHTFIEFV